MNAQRSPRTLFSTTITIACGVHALLPIFAISTARAQDLYVAADRTIANGTPINGTFGTVKVGRDINAVNYNGVHADVTGGVITGAFFSYNTSVVNITGGDFKKALLPQNASVLNFGGTAVAEAALAVFDTAKANITGGRINTVQAGVLGGTDTPTVNFGGTAQTLQIQPFAHSTANITGGTFGSVYSWDSSTVNISGGLSDDSTFANSVFGNYNSSFNISGGELDFGIDMEDSSNLHLTGGIVKNGVFAGTDGTVTVTGGTISGGLNGEFGAVTVGAGAHIDDVYGYQNVTTITGGFMLGNDVSAGGDAASLFGDDSSVFNISGGIFGNNAIVNYGVALGGNAATFNFFGTGLTATNGMAGFYNDGMGDLYGGVYWTLSGKLQNGDILNTRYFDYGGSLAAPANINGVTVSAAAPEPGPLTLLSFICPIIGASACRSRAARRRLCTKE